MKSVRYYIHLLICAVLITGKGVFISEGLAGKDGGALKGKKNKEAVEEHCRRAIKKLVYLVKKDPARKKTFTEIQQIAARENARCIENYNEDTLDCILISETFEEARHCKNTGKSGLLRTRDCHKVVTHMFHLMEMDPKIKKETEALRKFYKEDEINKCVREFNREFNVCIMKARIYREMSRCKKF